MTGNAALVCCAVGLFLIYFELARPRFVVPGVAGAVSVVVGAHSLATRPDSVNPVLLGALLLLAFAVTGVLGYFALQGWRNKRRV